MAAPGRRAPAERRSPATCSIGSPHRTASSTSRSTSTRRDSPRFPAARSAPTACDGRRGRAADHGPAGTQRDEPRRRSSCVGAVADEDVVGRQDPLRAPARRRRLAAPPGARVDRAAKPRPSRRARCARSRGRRRRSTCPRRRSSPCGARSERCGTARAGLHSPDEQLQVRWPSQVLHRAVARSTSARCCRRWASAAVPGEALALAARRSS